MKTAFLIASLLLTASLAQAEVVGSYSGDGEYKDDDGATDTCTLGVNFTKAEATLTFYLSTVCKNLEFEQTIPLDLNEGELSYNGEKVGMITDTEVIVEGMKVENDIYSFKATQKEDLSVDYSDKYCYGGEFCEELNGNLAFQKDDEGNLNSYASAKRH